jgi:3-dehydroquinate synthase
VAPLYAERIAAAVGRDRPTTLVAFPAGEWNKNRETWASVTDRLLAAGLGRDGAVLAVGGGVVGDVAGFVAATYLRGVPYVQIPTTLLAMIDSSVGGKTGVDTPLGKNLVGAFYQPRAVLADVTTLASLPRLHLAAGMAEAMKHGAIADAGYFTKLTHAAPGVFAHDRATLFDAVRRSIEIKVEVVTADEREHGRRATLNFGHTVAHALESVSGYEMLHGEAVAIGMASEAELGERLGVTAAGTGRTLAAALEKYGLPTAIPADLDSRRLLEVMLHDKKVRARSVRFALIQRIGELARAQDGEWTHTVEEETLRGSLGPRA